jgi:hypothetical protein
MEFVVNNYYKLTFNLELLPSYQAVFDLKKDFFIGQLNSFPYYIQNYDPTTPMEGKPRIRSMNDLTDPSSTLIIELYTDKPVTFYLKGGIPSGFVTSIELSSKEDYEKSLDFFSGVLQSDQPPSPPPLDKARGDVPPSTKVRLSEGAKGVLKHRRETYGSPLERSDVGKGSPSPGTKDRLAPIISKRNVSLNGSDLVDMVGGKSKKHRKQRRITRKRI